MEKFLLNPFYLEDGNLKTCTSEGMVFMDEFFLKLGLMTQKNHKELLQAFNELRMSIEALTKEIAKLNSQVVESHTDLSNKISSLAEATKNISSHVTESFSKVEVAQIYSDKKISTLKEETTTNHATLAKGFSTLIKETTASHATLDKKLSMLENQTITDTRAVKESLENVEELLRLTAANQIMNLVDK